MISYFQAAVLGVLQGVTELFPISSLGHSVLVPALIGGSWKDLVTQSSTTNSQASPYLAFIVALHVGTAVALLIFFRSDWVRIISAWFRSIGPTFKARRIVARDSDERLAWLLVIGTIPVGITGVLLEHTFRTLFAKPLAAAVFLTINGLILLSGEVLRRRAPVDEEDDGSTPALGNDAREATVGRHATDGAVTTQRRTRRLVTLSYREGFLIGLFQTAALLAGISRSGVAMVGGLARGLSHRDAARFSFLLATPVILAAGVLKLPSLTGPSASDIRGQVIVGAVLAGVAAFVSVKWLTKYFETRTLIPFAIYSLVTGIFCIIWFA
ncbi:MAG TPA: undecaprenyl-diphosphate phosphatase [Jatrophihabitans sp.]|jgi:undecaprenyl-diphosphatase